MNAVLVIISVLFVQPQAAPSMRMRSAPAATVPLTEAAARLYKEYARPLEAELLQVERMGEEALLADVLARRVSLAEAARTSMASLSVLEPADLQSASRNAWGLASKIDVSNVAFLRRHIAPNEWFPISRYGERVNHNAWLIVQHAPDLSLQQEVLKRMERLVAANEVRRQDYALLFDRVRLQEGGQQRYGSQLECRDGVYRPRSLEDPVAVDARRAEMGLPPLQQYLASFPATCSR